VLNLEASVSIPSVPSIHKHAINDPSSSCKIENNLNVDDAAFVGGTDDKINHRTGSNDLLAKSSFGGSGTSNNSSFRRLSQSVRSSYCFERSIMDEFNLCIEREQLDSSFLTLPVVPAVFDNDSPENETDSNPTDFIREPVTIKKLSPINLTKQQPLLIPIEPAEIVLGIGRFQRTAYTFFVCDTNMIEDDCIKECSQLSELMQTQTIFCFGDYRQEIMYPPLLKVTKNNLQAKEHMAAVLHDCSEAIRSAKCSTTTKETTIKLLEIAKRVPFLDCWPRDRIAVVIATDRTFGTKGGRRYKKFITAVQALLKLGVHIVVRLSSTKPEVVAFYDFLKQSFASIVILYTFENQKKLVQKNNLWLNYGLPLHRTRELGYIFHRTIDLLSNRRLDKDELRAFFVAFYGTKVMIQAPDIHTEWADFFAYVSNMNRKEGKHRLGLQRNNKNRRDYWIDLKQLEKLYREKSIPFLRRRRLSLTERVGVSQLRVEI
jgi:hypothetical protein